MCPVPVRSARSVASRAVLSAVVIALALLSIGAVAGQAPPAPRPDPRTELWRRRTNEALRKKVTFDFVETPFQDVATFLSSLVDVTIVLDPKGVRNDTSITLRVSEMPLQDAWTQACKLAGVVHTVMDEALFVTTAARMKEVARLDEALRPLQQPPTRELGEKAVTKVTFDLVEKSCKDVAIFLAELTQLPVAFDAEAVKDPPTVTLRVKEMQVGAAIRWCCRLTGLACVWRGEKLVITTPERALAKASKRRDQ
jgi:hypothetical protein